METHIYIAVILAAGLHAGWNTLVKIGTDRFSMMLLLSLVHAGLAIPILPFVDIPPAAAWPWIIASALLHVGYQLFLVKAYAHADLSQAYPLARGTAPLIVTVLSLAFLGAMFTPVSLVAILAVSFGILLMAAKGADGGSMRLSGVFWALGTACFIAGYTLADGIGARITGSATGFIMWMMVFSAVGMTAFAVATRGRSAFPALVPSLRVGTLAGAMSLLAYWIVVWAFTQAPIALVATLRESSIVFATFIAYFALGEDVTRWRWISVCAIVCGAALMKL